MIHPASVMTPEGDVGRSMSVSTVSERGGVVMDADGLMSRPRNCQCLVMIGVESEYSSICKDGMIRYDKYDGRECICVLIIHSS